MLLSFTYLGLTDAEKKRRLDRQMKNPLVPPEKRGQPNRFRIDLKEDTYEEMEEKKKLAAQWHRDRKQDMVRGIEDADAKATLVNPETDKPIVFPKGKVVVLDAEHPLVPKLKTMSIGGSQPKTYPAHQIVKHEQFAMDEVDEKEHEDRLKQAKEAAAKADAEAKKKADEDEKAAEAARKKAADAEKAKSSTAK